MKHKKDATQQRIIDNRRRYIARLFCEGITNQFEIAETLAERYNIVAQDGNPLNQSIISRDLKVIETGWKKEATDSIDAMKAQFRARYETIYGEAFSAWLRSLEDAETTIQEMIDSGEPVKLDSKGNPLPAAQRLKASTRKEGQSGNPALLAQAQAALKAIREMFGVDASTKVDITWRDKLPPNTDPNEVIRQFRAIMQQAANQDKDASK